MFKFIPGADALTKKVKKNGAKEATLIVDGKKYGQRKLFVGKSFEVSEEDGKKWAALKLGKVIEIKNKKK